MRQSASGGSTGRKVDATTTRNWQKTRVASKQDDPPQQKASQSQQARANLAAVHGPSHGRHQLAGDAAIARTDHRVRDQVDLTTETNGIDTRVRGRKADEMKSWESTFGHAGKVQTAGSDQ